MLLLKFGDVTRLGRLLSLVDDFELKELLLGFEIFTLEIGRILLGVGDAVVGGDGGGVRGVFCGLGQSSLVVGHRVRRGGFPLPP